MSIGADASTTKGPEVGSEEWVEQTLKARGLQGDEPDASDSHDETQDDGSEASVQTSVAAGSSSATAALNWRDVVIPADDPTVPEHFRGKPVAMYETARRELENQWNQDRQRMRELEAKVAAKETFKEFLTEQQQVAKQQSTTPADPYRDAGIDLETDPVLNPTKFFPKQEQLILEKAKQLMAEELRKRDEEAARLQQVKTEEARIAAALAHVEKERGLTETQMRERIPSMLMAVGEKFGRDALKDPSVVLQAHDAIFGAPAAPVSIPATQQAPNPPGVKRPVSVEATAKSGPNLKAYEREILGQVSEEMSNMLGGLKIDPDQLMARYAANLKRTRG